VVIQLVEPLCQLARNKESRCEPLRWISGTQATPLLSDEFSYPQSLLPMEIYEPIAKNG